MNSSRVVRKGSLAAGLLCPLSFIALRMRLRPNTVMSWSVAVLSLIEIIRLARLCSVSGAPLGQFCNCPLG